MRAWCPLVLTACLAILPVATVFGQRVTRQAIEYRGYDVLLQEQSIQKELKLTEEQLKKSQEVIRKVQKRYAQGLAKARAQKSVQVLEIGREISEETLGQLSDTFNPQQIKRLKEIQIQQQGLQAFSDPGVERVLRLTDEQKKKIKAIEEDFMQQVRPLFQRGAPGSFEVRLKKMTDLNKQAIEKSVGVLDADQRKTWKELLGEPFEVKGQSLRKTGEK